MAKNRIYIPTFISSVTYAPARVLPHIYFYNGLKSCEPFYIQGYENGNTASVVSHQQDFFPYFDNYEGNNPTSGSRSLLFYNEPSFYGTTPTGSLYTEYWSKYIDLLYNPMTRLFECSAIIPLANYFKMELNDIVEWRGNYYHLRAINDYNLKNGECKLQLLGPILGDILPDILPAIACDFDFTVGCGPIPTTTTTAAPTTTTTAAPTTTTLSPTTTTIAPPVILQKFRFARNTSPGDVPAGTFTDYNGVTQTIKTYTFGTDYEFFGVSGSVNLIPSATSSLSVLIPSASYPTFTTYTFSKANAGGLAGFTVQNSGGDIEFYNNTNPGWVQVRCAATGTAKETWDPLGLLTITTGGACTPATTTTTVAPTTTIPPTTTTTTTSLNIFTNCGFGSSVGDACSDAVNNSRTLWSDCSSFGPGCVVYTDAAGTAALLGYSYVFINNQVYDINSSTGVITGVSIIQC